MHKFKAVWPVLLLLQRIRADLTASAVISSPDGAIAGNAVLKWIEGGGTNFKLTVDKGLTANSYLYHIHTASIPAGSNCSAALGHLDPSLSAECTSCKDPNTCQPWLCQEGDLSGKHGPLIGSAAGPGSAEFTDGYLRFWPVDFSVLGRSIVIHKADKTPIACGNIISAVDGTADPSGKATGAKSTYQTYPETGYVKGEAGKPGWVPSVQEAPAIQLQIGSDGSRSIKNLNEQYIYDPAKPLPVNSFISSPGGDGAIQSGGEKGGTIPMPSNLLTLSLSGIDLSLMPSSVTNSDGVASVSAGDIGLSGSLSASGFSNTNAISLPSNTAGAETNTGTEGSTPSQSANSSSQGIAASIGFVILTVGLSSLSL